MGAQQEAEWRDGAEVPGWAVGVKHHSSRKHPTRELETFLEIALEGEESDGIDYLTLAVNDLLNIAGQEGREEQRKAVERGKGFA